MLAIAQDFEEYCDYDRHTLEQGLREERYTTGAEFKMRAQHVAYETFSAFTLY